jgi:hypothetical protein
MLALVGTLLALSSAVVVVLFVLGGADFVGGRWRSGVRKLVLSVGLSLLACLSLGWSTRAMMHGELWTEEVAPEAKARVLAETISALMNVTALGLASGLVAGAVLVWRRRVRAGGG